MTVYGGIWKVWCGVREFLLFFLLILKIFLIVFEVSKSRMRILHDKAQFLLQFHLTIISRCEVVKTSSVRCCLSYEKDAFFSSWNSNETWTRRKDLEKWEKKILGVMMSHDLRQSKWNWKLWVNNVSSFLETWKRINEIIHLFWVWCQWGLLKVESFRMFVEEQKSFLLKNLRTEWKSFPRN